MSTRAFTAGVHHVGLTVPDIRATERFFVDVLGFRVVGEKPAVFVSDGTVMLTLWQAVEPDTASPFDRKRSIGLHHLALCVADRGALATAHDRITAAEGAAVEFAPEPLGASRIHHMMCTVPGGIRLELLAPAPEGVQ